MTPSPGATRRARLAAALLAGALAGALSGRVGGSGDLDQLLFGARAWAAGSNPYDVVGPSGRPFFWPWALYYPLPALAIVWPFVATLPTVAARAAFEGVGVALLTYGLTARGWALLPILVSAPCLYAVVVGQWAPLLTAAALLPGATVLWSAKPNVGLSLWAADPRWRRLAAPAAALLATAVLWPWWPAAWFSALATGPQFAVPARMAWGVPLLALLRWRRPEARLLAALACVPQSGFVYEALPLLAMVPATRVQALALALASYAVPIGVVAADPSPYAAAVHTSTWLLLAFCYLPCLVLVLRRPNDGPVPAWLERAVEWPRLWRRSRPETPSEVP
ncbi:MAG: hypothetical protein ACJ79S_01195 [Gemmatimonadaceae bacterium]